MPQSPPVRHGSGAMFDAIAARYDFLNRLMSLGLDRRWRRELIRHALSEHTLSTLQNDPQHNAPFLDVATGTADVALALAKAHRGMRVLGVDPSPKMLALGEAKVVREALQERIALQSGDALNLPSHAEGFLGATISFGIRNFPDRLGALKRLGQAVRPGGRIVILELTEPTGRFLGPLARWHIHTFVPWLGALLSGKSEYKYLAQSIAQFPPPPAFEALMREAGLESVHSKPLAFGAVTLFSATAPARGVA